MAFLCLQGVPLAADPAWPTFRGNRALTGVADGTLPDRLALQWSVKAGDVIQAAPVIGHGLVYVGASDGTFHALRLASGKKAWAYDTGDAVEAPAVLAAGLVCVGDLGGTLHALDAQTGIRRWRYRTEGRIAGSANWFRASCTNASGAATRPVRILVGSYDNKLHCVDGDTGQPVWTHTTDNFINGAPSVAEGVAVFGGCDAKVHVVSLANGRERHAIEAGSYVAGSIAVHGGRAYLGHYDCRLLAVDLARARIAWTYGDDDTGAFFSSPAVTADRVLAGARDKAVHCVNRKDGTAVWTFRTRGEVDSSPVVCGDKVVFGSKDGTLYMLRTADGKRVWSYEVGAAITGGPAVAGGRVVVGAEDGRVYAFGPEP